VEQHPGRVERDRPVPRGRRRRLLPPQLDHPRDGGVRDHLHHGGDREREHLHRDRLQQVDAHRHQLLPLQSGDLGYAAAHLGAAPGDVQAVVPRDVRLRGGVLHPAGVRG
jgi:hypothetical protein